MIYAMMMMAPANTSWLMCLEMAEYNPYCSAYLDMMEVWK